MCIYRPFMYTNTDNNIKNTNSKHVVDDDAWMQIDCYVRRHYDSFRNSEILTIWMAFSWNQSYLLYLRNILLVCQIRNVYNNWQWVFKSMTVNPIDRHFIICTKRRNWISAIPNTNVYFNGKSSIHVDVACLFRHHVTHLLALTFP